MDNDINIVQSRLPEAVDALEKLNKKAVRYGADPVTWSPGKRRCGPRTGGRATS